MTLQMVWPEKKIFPDKNILVKYKINQRCNNFTRHRTTIFGTQQHILICYRCTHPLSKVTSKRRLFMSLQTLKRRPLRSQNESFYDVFFWRLLHVWYRRSWNLRTRLKTSSNGISRHSLNIIQGSFRPNLYCFWTK